MVAASFLCREIIKVMPKANFRLYGCECLWGIFVISWWAFGSISLIIATKGNFSEAMIGRLIPLSETLLSPLNFFLSGTLLFLMPVVNWYISRSEGLQDKVYKVVNDDIKLDESAEDEYQKGPAEKLELSRSVGFIAGSFGLGYIFS
ncbi:MAG: TIGR00366 family protein [Holosporaceae bacterium]|nr:MAG: TIGR00366 family protein [Holosporaceae bacterium]